MTAAGPMEWSCGVCGRPLDVTASVGDDGTPVPIAFMHTPVDADDHVPVPVNRPPAVLLCDLCTAPDPAWVVPVKNVERENVFVPDAAPQLDVGALWAACDDCARLVDRRDLNGIVSRYRRGPGPPAPVRLLREHFENFLASVIGPARRA